MKKIWILSLLALLACKEESPQMLPYAGRFMAESLIADVPVDLNFDGIYSTDFLSETIHMISGLKQHLSISHEPYSNSLGYMLSVVWIRNSPYGDTSLGRGSLSSGLRFDPDTKLFHLVNNDLNVEQVEEGSSNMVEGIEILEIRAIDTNHIFVKLMYDQRIFDFRDNTWKTVIVDGSFKRRQDTR